MRYRAGVRSYLVVAMTFVAITSAVVTGFLARAAIASELAEGNAHLTDELEACVLRAVVQAGIVSAALALALALPIALHLARPLRRLNVLAGRLARGGTATSMADVRGGHEVAQLAATLEHLAVTLRRQDDLRRHTAADVTHELRGAVGALAGRIEAVQDGAIAADTGLARLAVDVRRLGVIVDDVQRLAEAQRPGLLVRTQPVDLGAVVRDRLAAHAHSFAAASIRLSDEIGSARVDGDTERLGQVVDNLLSNALRYTDAGGEVTVALTIAEGEAVLDVCDSGIGIAPEDLPRVFDRFWRAPRAAERAPAGSGVGLAVVCDLVLAHQGRVEAGNRPGGGARFQVRLPLASADASRAHAGTPRFAAARTPAGSLGA